MGVGGIVQLLLLAAGLWTVTWQSVDLNLGQLQYVSDHLTIQECQRLITALHQKSFQLTPKDLSPDKSKQPCLYQLTEWNKATGQEGTVEDLTLRLHQIGRTDVARDIAIAVYGETSREIHKYFLDNPFKAMAQRHNSRLMEDDDEEEEKVKKVEAVDSLRVAVSDHRFAVAVVVLTLTVTCMTVVVVRAYCPGACATMCPDRLVALATAMQDSISESLHTLRSLTLEELTGEKLQRAAPPKNQRHREEQERLVQSLLHVSSYPQEA